MAAAHGNLRDLLPASVHSTVAGWLAEDCPSFDCGGFVVGSAPSTARLLCKSDGVLAGVPFFDEVFAQLGCSVEWQAAEGAVVGPGSGRGDGSTSNKPDLVATVKGPVNRILLGERVALNTLARCSGVATATARVVAALRGAVREGGTAPVLAGTRKTTPGFRLVEKYGMRVGGADPHRHDLAAMTMLKDNHVWACGGSIGRAVAAAKAAGGFALKVEVECQSLAEAEEAVDAGADVVMLDNFDGPRAAEAAASLRDRYGKGRFLIEISGGLTQANLAEYANAGVDVLSTSSIHQGVPHVDFSLKITH